VVLKNKIQKIFTSLVTLHENNYRVNILLYEILPTIARHEKLYNFHNDKKLKTVLFLMQR